MSLETINNTPMVRDIVMLSISSLSTAACSFITNIMPLVQLLAVIIAIVSGFAALYLTHLKIKALKAHKE